MCDVGCAYLLVYIMCVFVLLLKAKAEEAEEAVSREAEEVEEVEEEEEEPE